jgi:hypothetical protein
MTPQQADRVSGTGLKIQSKIKQFELRHPVPITPANISLAVIVPLQRSVCHNPQFFLAMDVGYEGINPGFSKLDSAARS